MTNRATKETTISKDKRLKKIEKLTKEEEDACFFFMIIFSTIGSFLGLLYKYVIGNP